MLRLSCKTDPDKHLAAYATGTSDIRKQQSDRCVDQQAFNASPRRLHQRASEVTRWQVAKGFIITSFHRRDNRIRSRIVNDSRVHQISLKIQRVKRLSSDTWFLHAIIHHDYHTKEFQGDKKQLEKKSQDMCLHRHDNEGLLSVTGAPDGIR